MSCAHEGFAVSLATVNIPPEVLERLLDLLERIARALERRDLPAHQPAAQPAARAAAGQLLSTLEVAARLGVSEANARRIMRRLDLVRVGLGRRQLLKVRADEIERWVKAGGDLNGGARRRRESASPKPSPSWLKPIKPGTRPPKEP